MRPRTAKTVLIVIGVFACILAVGLLALGIASLVSGGAHTVTAFLLATVLGVLGVADVVVVRQRRRP